MGLFRRTEQRDVATELLSAVRTGRTGGMAPVTSDRALQASAVWSCYRILAGIGSTLPLDQFSGDRPITTSPVLREPVVGQPVSDWLHRLWVSILSTGNVYGLCSGTEDGARIPTSVELIDPSDVSWRQVDGRWTAFVNNKRMDLWPNGPLWHVPLFTVPGSPVGLSPIKYAAATIGGSLAAQEFGSRFFTDGGTPSAILYNEAPDLTPEQAAGIKAAFLRATRGNREPAVLGSGLKYERISVSPDESQFLESMQWSASQIATAIGVPPEWIGAAVSGQSVTYANREQNWQDFTSRDLVPYLVRIEAGISRLLPQPQRVKFNMGALLRADLMARYQSYEIAARIGDVTGTPLLQVNEMRDFENMPPLQGGDDFARRTDPAPLPSPQEAPSAP